MIILIHLTGLINAKVVVHLKLIFAKEMKLNIVDAINVMGINLNFPVYLLRTTCLTSVLVSIRKLDRFF